MATMASDPALMDMLSRLGSPGGGAPPMGGGPSMGPLPPSDPGFDPMLDSPDAGMPGGMGGDPASSGPSGVDALREALNLIKKYQETEKDEEDLLVAEDITSRIQKLLANQQKLADTATGAGPGAKLMRKLA